MAHLSHNGPSFALDNCTAGSKEPNYKDTLMNDDAACSDVKLADQDRVSKGETLKSETLEFYLLTDLNLDILELEVDLNVLEFTFLSWC